MVPTYQCVTWRLLVFLTAGLVETTDSSVDDISISNQDFAVALYSEIAKENNSSNIFFSPLSIHTILALAYVGAEGQTAQEMAAGLRLPANLDVVKTGFQLLLQGLNNNADSVELELANKIYWSKDLAVNDKLEITATHNLLSEIQYVDFSLAAKTAKTINELVENKTHGKMKDIVSGDSLNPLADFVLVNSMYFKASWENVPVEQLYRSAEFHMWRTKNVRLMTQEYAVVVHNSDLGARILELDYKGNTMSLVIILPIECNGLPDVEKKLRGTNLATIFESFKGNKNVVNVVLPKFKLEQTLQLNKYLKALGMTAMFADNADHFSSLIGAVLHKSFIEVNEKRTEAAAATSNVDIMMSSLNRTTPEFVADHPFVFILRCKRSGAVIFMGRYADPQ